MSDDLTEEDFTALAAEMFRRLDEGEDAKGAWARRGVASGLWDHAKSPPVSLGPMTEPATIKVKPPQRISG